MEFETDAESNSRAKLITLFLLLLIPVTLWRADVVRGLKGAGGTPAHKSASDLAATESISCVGPSGSLQCDSFGNFVVAHGTSEFATENEINPAWAFSDHSVDLTPPAVSRISTDDPSPADAMFGFNDASPSAFPNGTGSGASSAGFQGAGFQGSGFFGGYPYAGGGTPGSTNGSTNRKTSTVNVSTEGSDDPTPTPEPSSFLLLASGLVGLIRIARRR